MLALLVRLDNMNLVHTHEPYLSLPGKGDLGYCSCKLQYGSQVNTIVLNHRSERLLMTYVYSIME